MQYLIKKKYKGTALPHMANFSVFSQQLNGSIIPEVSHGRLQQLQKFVSVVKSFILFIGLFAEACSFAQIIFPNLFNENSSRI